MGKKLKESIEDRELLYDLIGIIFIFIFVIIFLSFGFESYYRKLMLPMGLVLISQVMIYDYYAKKNNRGIWPNVVSILIIAVIFWMFFRSFDLYSFKNISLINFFIRCMFAWFCSLLVIGYVFKVLFDNKQVVEIKGKDGSKRKKKKKVSEPDSRLNKAEKNVRR